MAEDRDVVREASEIAAIRETLHRAAGEINRAENKIALRRSVAMSDLQAGTLTREKAWAILESCIDMEIYVERARKAITTADISAAKRDPAGRPALKRRRRTRRIGKSPVPEAAKKRRRWRGYT